MKTYYIYHVIGSKIGATSDLENRNNYNRNRYQIEPIVLETMEGPDTPEYWQIVGDREWELADLYGYDRGTHYLQMRLQRSAMGQSGGLSKSDLKLTKLLQNRVTWKETSKFRNREKVLYNAKNNGGTGKVRQCVHCGISINLMNIGRHETKCSQI